MTFHFNNVYTVDIEQCSNVPLVKPRAYQTQGKRACNSQSPQ